MPGTITLPGEIDHVGAGRRLHVDDGPIAMIFSFRMTIVASWTGAAPVPSINVAWVSTRTWADAASAENRKRGRIRRIPTGS